MDNMKHKDDLKNERDKLKKELQNKIYTIFRHLNEKEMNDKKLMDSMKRGDDLPCGHQLLPSQRSVASLASLAISRPIPLTVTPQ